MVELIIFIALFVQTTCVLHCIGRWRVGGHVTQLNTVRRKTTYHYIIEAIF
jgi:hypothetical protein